MRPAVSDEITTESAPDCSNKCWFSDSRTLTTIHALGASSRTDKVTSTAVSSMLGATTTAFALPTPASFRIFDWVPEPFTVTKPCASATSNTRESLSTTTMSFGDVPSANNAATADLPFVP